MIDGFISRWIHAKNNGRVSDSDFLKILDDALLNFGERCLVSYSKSYEENPKAMISSFLKYDSIKMACQHVVKYARRSGILKELEGQKDFSVWIDKQSIDAKWKPVMNNFLLILWGISKK